MSFACPILYLAPMAEITDAPFRGIAREYGADVTVTEMISAAGLARGNRRTRMMLEHTPDERPLAVQLYGGDPDEMAEAARIAAKFGGFDAIDINAGCPVPKVLKCGGGAALMRTPAKIGGMVAKIREASGLPVTVKTRIGLNPKTVTIFDVLRAVEEAGATSIAVHGRFASAGHGGAIDLPLLAETVAAAKIPVTVNGGINNADDALRVARETHAAGLMIGRAAIGKPWIFGEIKRRFSSREPANENSRPALTVFEEHLKRIVSFYGSFGLKYPELFPDPEKPALRAFTSHLFRYFSGIAGANGIRRGMNSCRSVDDILRLVKKEISSESEP